MVIKECQASDLAEPAAVSPPIPPPTGDQFPGNDGPGHATNLVTTQQPDKALHLTIVGKMVTVQLQSFPSIQRQIVLAGACHAAIRTAAWKCTYWKVAEHCPFNEPTQSILVMRAAHLSVKTDTEGEASD